MTLIDSRAARALAAKARRNGGIARGAITTEWHIAGDCVNPILINLDGRLDRERSRGEYFDSIDLGKGGGFVTKRNAPHFLELYIRCTKCDNCIAHKKRLWTARLHAEHNMAARTWFGTLTASPSWRLHYVASAVARLRAASVDYYALTTEERAREVTKEMGKELTKYVKRIRKRCRVRGIRMFFVFELHKDGMPHIHGLFFEPLDGHGNITKRHLDHAWSHGFSQWRLLTDPKRLTYALKYVTKDSFFRIRASARFGSARPTPKGGQRPLGTVKRDKGCDPLPKF